VDGQASQAASQTEERKDIKEVFISLPAMTL